MLTMTLLGLWALILAGRDTPAGRALHRLLVEMPCRRIATVSRGQVLLAILTLTIVVALVWGLENDGRMLVTMGWPEFMAFASAVDLSALLDLAAVAAVTAGTIRIRAVRDWLTRRFARPRRPRSRVRRPARRGDDAEDRPARPAVARPGMRLAQAAWTNSRGGTGRYRGVIPAFA